MTYAATSDRGSGSDPAWTGLVIAHVDDSQDDLEMFARAFRRSGIAGRVYSLQTIEAAVAYLHNLGEYLGAARPGLFVIDYSMAWMDGRALITFIKTSTARLASVPIVLLSGSDDPALREECLRFGADHFVAKPQTIEGLIEVVRALPAWAEGAKKH
jgi:CheY-like chemotaxis protein